MISLTVTETDADVENLLAYLGTTKLSLQEKSFLLDRAKLWLDHFDKCHYSPTTMVTIRPFSERPQGHMQLDTEFPQQPEPQNAPAIGKS